ncbi:S8 family peptidase [Pyxidicoccus xibeiensis]|uniref:S8 family peptidase n=1 Tax=Pyxidicoccus xibeiensis TaxID=2906759 RepID=UPI0020A83846|nr:S8 family serine peptidase [Pyxidicoccus xibeiensis]MCP3137091.1 S8 family serine peptidase [Pyxidicoccus xibeiensis]
MAGAVVPGCESRPAPPPAPTAVPSLQRPATPAYVEGEVLVRFRDDAPALKQDATHAVKGARVMHRFRKLAGLQHVRLPEGTSVEQALEHYRRDPLVAYAEPNFIYMPSALPADSRFGELWALDNTGQTLGTVDADLNVPEAWAILQERESGVVAVIDSGVDFTHPDLADNMWVNPGEVAGNGVDDDGNGYVDDVHGIDATDYTRTKPPMDVNGHGTHVAGTIAARAGNGPGVVGVSPRTKLIACKMEDASGSFKGDAALRCLDYLLDLKTRARHPVNLIATNNSWGGASTSQALQGAINRHLHAGILFVAAAGNAGLDLDADGGAFYPAEHDLPNVLSVGASDAWDRRAPFSNHGRQRVDIFAPGTSILSTALRGGFAIYQGTSMAAPHVTGLVALLHAQEPGRDWRALRNLVLSGGQQVPALRDHSVTGRRIRAVGTGGVGSLTCADQTVVRRLEPSGDVVHAGEERPDFNSIMTLAALNIRCDQAAGPVTVQLSVEPWSLVLLDDGQGPDRVAGDGIATAEWAPPEEGGVTVTFPGGDTFTAHRLFSGTPGLFSDERAYWNPHELAQADFRVSFWDRGTPAPYVVQWDADYDGRFDVDASKSEPGSPPPGRSWVHSSVQLVPSNPEPTAVAVRVLDATGNASRIQQFPPTYLLEHPAPVELAPEVVVPQVRHPFTLDIAFIAPLRAERWVVEWDLDHDGVSFRPTAQDPITELVSLTGARVLGRGSRVHAFPTTGVHRVAARVVGQQGGPSSIITWGAVVACGTPVILDVSVEGEGRTEPVTAGLSARAEPGCEPILRYHWDFDGDGRFDEVTTEPSTRRVYADNAAGNAPQRGVVRVESATGHYDRAFEVPVENAPPRVELIPKQVVTKLEPMTYQVQASDPGPNDVLSFTVKGAPEWVRVDRTTGLLSWDPPASWATRHTPLDFDVVVSDGDEAFTAVSVKLVSIYQPQAIPEPPPREEDGGCSTTGGLCVPALVLLGLLPWGRRRTRARPRARA